MQILCMHVCFVCTATYASRTVNSYRAFIDNITDQTQKSVIITVLLAISRQPEYYR